MNELKKLVLISMVAFLFALLTAGTGTAVAATYPNANCLVCHGPGGSATSHVDFTVPVTSTGMVNKAKCYACHKATGHDLYAPGRITVLKNGVTIGKFISVASVDLDPVTVHAYHSENMPSVGTCVGRCHQRAACESCHGSVSHNLHGSLTTPVVLVGDGLSYGVRLQACANDFCHKSYAVESQPYCAGCHDGTHSQFDTINRTLGHGGGYTATQHTATSLSTTYRNYACNKCHITELLPEHAKTSSSTAGLSCAACHPTPRSTFTTWNKTCSQVGCHPATGNGSVHTAAADAAKHTTLLSCAGSCHNADVSLGHQRMGCATAGCHTDPNTVPTTTSCGAGNGGCHSDKTPTNHGGYNATTHTATSMGTTYKGVACNKCHITELLPEHVKTSSSTAALSCNACHPSPRSTLSPTWNKSCSQGSCHTAPSGAGSVHTADAAKHTSTATQCSVCHGSDVSLEHQDMGCATAGCHTGPNTVPTTTSCGAGNGGCHIDKTPTNHGGYNATTHTATSMGTTYRNYACNKCHITELLPEHVKTSSSTAGLSCIACHPTPRSSFTTWNKTCSQGGCHTATGNGSVHTAAADAAKHTLSPSCAGSCHNADVSLGHQRMGCATAGCHTDPNTVPTTTSCGAGNGGCHSDKTPTNHGGYNATTHTATSMGTTYRNYACNKCHITELLPEHVKTSSSTAGLSCIACHPTPRSSFTTWNKTCSQGGCHASSGTSSGSSGSSQVNADQATWYTRLSAINSADPYTGTNVTTAMSNNDTTTGYDVVKRTYATQVVVLRLNKNPSSFPGVSIYAYIRPASTSTTTVRIYNYAGTSTRTPSSYKDFSITGSGWKTFDVTSLASAMAGKGYIRLRMATNNNTYKVTEARFLTLTTSAPTGGTLHAQDAAKHTSAATQCQGSGCHVSDVSTLHATTIASNGTSTCGISNASGACHTSASSTTPTVTNCATCHPGKTPTNHGYNVAQHTASSQTSSCFASSCHQRELKTEHDKYLSRLGLTKSCDLCHTVRPGQTSTWAARVGPWNKRCDGLCHSQPHAMYPPWDTCGNCHGSVHGEEDHGRIACDKCHSPSGCSCHGTNPEDHEGEGGEGGEDHEGGGDD